MDILVPKEILLSLTVLFHMESLPNQLFLWCLHRLRIDQHLNRLILTTEMMLKSNLKKAMMRTWLENKLSVLLLSLA